SLVPALALGPAYRDHVVGEDPAEARIGHEGRALGGGYRRRIRTNLEIERLTATHSCLRAETVGCDVCNLPRTVVQQSADHRRDAIANLFGDDAGSRCTGGELARDRVFDALRLVVMAEVVKQQAHREDGRGRVGDALAGDVRGRAVHG